IVENSNRDRERRLLIERAISDLNADAQAPAALPGAPTEDLPVAQQLARAQQELHLLEMRLKPEHPDILRAKRVIAGLQQRAEAEALTTPVSPEGQASGPG